MSTATRPVRHAKAPSRVITSPLARVSRGIRTYVMLEGILLLVAFVAAWFWFALAVDWGMFKITGIDYVRDGGGFEQGLVRGLFLGLLGLGVLYIVGYRVFYRLFVAFRPAALALVIERKYPRVLGDRLVTAVELADPGIAEHYGYSWVMVEQTVQDAEDRLDQVSVRGVFNWGRLGWRFLIALGLVATVAAFAFFFYHVSKRWTQRNVFMENRHWDRNTMLIVHEFQNTDRRAVPYGGSLPVRVQALVNVVATDATPVGWRIAEWPDLVPQLMDPAQPDHKLYPEYKGDVRAWELKDLGFSVTLHRALPDSWRTLPIDFVENRCQVIQSDHLAKAEEGQALLAELGRSWVDSVLAQLAEVQAGKRSAIDPELRELLPEDWRDLPPERLSGFLIITKRLTQTESARLRQVLLQGQALPSDTSQAVNFLFASIKPPLMSMGQLQSMMWHPSYIVDTRALAAQTQVYALLPESPPLALTLGAGRILHEITSKPTPPREITLTDADRQMLLTEWRDLNVAELRDQLLHFEQTKGLAKLGERMRNRLGLLFKQLAERANQSHWGATYTYRRLAAPETIKVEFEEVLSAEEKARVRPKTGKTDVRRQPERFSYVYEGLHKIERETRIRISAGDAETPWFTVFVKEVPTLRFLRYRRSELGYIHSSNERVTIHGSEGRQDEDIHLVREGEESRLAVKSGSRVTITGGAHKDLEHFEVLPQDRQELHLAAKLMGTSLLWPVADAIGIGLAGNLQGACATILSNYVETQNPFLQSLTFDPRKDSKGFAFTLKEAINEDIKLLLRFRDTDGIWGTYKLTLSVVPDAEPRFEFAASEVVRRDAVTNKVVIPFSLKVTDDNGLLGLWYEVSIVKQGDRTTERKVLRTQVFPVRTFTPLWTPNTYESTRLKPSDPGARIAHQTLGQAQLFSALALAHAPLAGPLAAIQSAPVEVNRTFQREYRQRQGPEAPLNNADEYFDTMVLDLSPIETKDKDGKPIREEIEVPYVVSVRLVAKDNRVRTDQATGAAVPASSEVKHSEAFEFTVLTEIEVLAEETRREWDIRERCDGLLARLKENRDFLERLHKEFATTGGPDVKTAINIVREAERALRDSRDTLRREIIRDMRQIYREFWLNRVREEVLVRIDKLICRPLEALVKDDGPFDSALRVVGDTAKKTETEGLKTPPAEFKFAADEMTVVIKRFEEIIAEIKELESFNRVVERVRDITRAQRKVVADLKALHRKRLKEEVEKP